MSTITTELASIFRIKPKNFSPAFEVAACYLESNGKWLFLKSAKRKLEGGKWGVPGGKIEPGESAFHAAIRETFEETQICLDEGKLKFIGTIFMHKHNKDFVYHMYYQSFNQTPTVTINNEHQEYQWVSRNEMRELPLMAGGIEAFAHLRALSNKPTFLRKPFFFIRHGEIDINDKLLDADASTPLNNRGRDQAQRAKERIAALPIKSVCFSPIFSAVETKDILGSDLKLKEIEIDDLSECQAHIWNKLIQLEAGHGYDLCNEVDHFLLRALQGISTVLKKEESPLIVAHGGIHWAFCYHMLIANHPWRIGNCELIQFLPVGELAWEAKIVL